MEIKTIKREAYLAKIRPYYDSQYIKVITGLRRVGKSVLLRQIMDEIKGSGVDKNHIIYIDLEGRTSEDVTTRKALENRLDALIKDSNKYYIFIDEIQHIKKFEEAIASIRISYPCSLFVTGSNAKLLRGKLQDRLTGRAKEFVVMPFTYRESVEYKKANHFPMGEDDFKDYLKWGGMPQRYEETSEDGVQDYLLALYRSILNKDVYGQHQRITKSAFESVAKYTISNSGKLFSASAIARFLKGGIKDASIKSTSATINNYAKYLEECFFVQECLPYFLQGKEALKGTKKYYAIDPGVKTAIDNGISLDDTYSLEGIIYNELIYRGYKVYYGHLRNGEVDFVVCKEKKKCLIQVAYRIETMSTFNREYGALLKIKDASPKYVFSLDEKDTSHNGITHINIIDFLLGKVDIALS